MGVVWEARKAFYDAMAYRERKTIDDGQGPVIDPGFEVLVAVLDKKVRVHTSAAAEQDIRTAIRLAQEFGYDTLIEEATEAWRLVGELKESGLTVLISAPSATAAAPDGARARYHTLNLLAEAEVPFAIHTGAQLGTLHLVHEAMFAVRHGLSPEAALSAITLGPAKILGIDDRVGSLAPGKDADFVIWTADPFDPTARAERVLIAGREVQP
jgi:imidazolonepropionase-like amidohydrolase